ncbi:Uncharacterised protein [Candidatus Gugararchaeum adminiculabundum]|nr:Uncharacterised protein [Candidatus Gugararchaeum adminiculabundum]
MLSNTAVRIVWAGEGPDRARVIFGSEPLPLALAEKNKYLEDLFKSEPIVHEKKIRVNIDCERLHHDVAISREIEIAHQNAGAKAENTMRKKIDVAEERQIGERLIFNDSHSEKNRGYKYALLNANAPKNREPSKPKPVQKAKQTASKASKAKIDTTEPMTLADIEALLCM